MCRPPSRRSPTIPAQSRRADSRHPRFFSRAARARSAGRGHPHFRAHATRRKRERVASAKPTAHPRGHHPSHDYPARPSRPANARRAPVRVIVDESIWPWSQQKRRASVAHVERLRGAQPAGSSRAWALVRHQNPARGGRGRFPRRHTRCARRWSSRLHHNRTRARARGETGSGDPRRGSSRR